MCFSFVCKYEVKQKAKGLIFSIGIGHHFFYKAFFAHKKRQFMISEKCKNHESKLHFNSIFNGFYILLDVYFQFQKTQKDRGQFFSFLSLTELPK